MKRLILFAAGLAFALSAAAQPGARWPEPGQQPQMKSRLTVEQAAKLRTDQMAAEIPLTEKQIKKVYNYFKRDIKYRREHFQFSGPRPGGPRPEGGPGMGPGGQRPSGPPPSGMGPGGQRPQVAPGMGPGTPPRGFEQADPEEIERYNARQEKKLRKIIGDENYAKWRANHPAGKI